MFNLHSAAHLYRLPFYLAQWYKFVRRARMSAPLLDSYPCLADATRKTPFDPHYFFQSAWLARKLAMARPQRHMDIGSDISLVSTLSAFVNVTFVDYRPLEVKLDGLQCRQGDIVGLPFSEGTVPSLSCLHVIEHVGLGRYGDPLDAQGHVRAAAELARVLANQGSLFVSVPVGRARTCFNAHRVFDARAFAALFPALQLHDFAYVDDAGNFREHADLRQTDDCEYGCGMFHFIKA